MTMATVPVLSPRIALLVLAAALPAQAPPTVVSLQPQHGAAGLDAAATQQLIVKFDQDMDPAMHTIAAAGASLPIIEREAWVDARTYLIQVQLEPAHVYDFDLSCAGSPGFVARSGSRLPPTPWRFATSGTALPDGTASDVTSRLFRSLRQRYAYRDRLGVDWAQLERQQTDRIGAVADGPGLALLLADVLSTAQDPHITVRWDDCVIGTFAREAALNFDPRSVRSMLPKLTAIGQLGMWTRTADGIGYLFVNSFAREQAGDFPQLLQVLRGMLDCKGLVIDVRTNVGGDEQLARKLAAFFVVGEKVYGASRERKPDGSDGFDEPQELRVRGNEAPDNFLRPVAVLMGRQVLGNCEAFLLMMKQAPQVTMIGDNSYGSAGDSKTLTLLPNLTVTLRTAQMLRADGTLFEGEGLSPQIHVKADAAQLAEGDPVLHEALLRVRNQR